MELQGVFEIMVMILTSTWIPILVNVVVRRVSAVRRLICTGILIAMYLAGSIIVDGSEIFIIVYMSITMLSVYFLMGRSVWNSLLIPVAYMIGVLVNYTMEIFSMTVFKRELLSYGKDIYIIFMLAGTVLVGVLAVSLRMLINAVKKQTKYREFDDMKIIIIADVILYMLVFLINGYAVRQMDYPDNMEYVTYTLFLVYGILTMGITVIFYGSIKNKEERKRDEEIRKNLLEYTKQIENMYEGLRKFKHDYVNILATMSAYIENGDMDELKQYFQKNIVPTNEMINNENYHLQKLSRIKNMAVKGLLSSKIVYASAKGVDVYIDIVDDVDNIAMKDIDITRILGIYFDNAIEAAIESENKDMKFNVICSAHSKTITLMNTYADKHIDIKNISKRGISTKGEDRGIGLANVEEILNNYKNVYKITEIKNGYFIQRLIIGDDIDT